MSEGMYKWSNKDMGMNFKILIKEFWITQKWFNDNLGFSKLIIFLSPILRKWGLLKKYKNRVTNNVCKNSTSDNNVFSIGE